MKNQKRSARKRGGGGSKSVLNVGRPPLFIEVGKLKKISKKRMGENPKKGKGYLDKSKLIFQIRTSFSILIISFYSKFWIRWNVDSWREIWFSTTFQKWPSPNFEFNYAKSSLELESEICYMIYTFLKCFPTLKLYLDEFKSYFHDKPHSKVIIRIFK